MHGMADAGSRFKFQSGTHGPRLGIQAERVIKIVMCVVMSVRVLVMYCGSVQYNII